MDAATLDARHLQELQNLETVLKAMDFPAKLLQKAGPIPQHALVTRVAMPTPHPSLEMALTFYPVDPNTIQHTLLLQYYIQLPFDLDKNTRDHYRLLLPDINGKTVLGHFGLDIDSGKPHYRYVQALPIDRPITKAAVVDVIVLVGYTPALFADVLSALANKKVDVATARKQLELRYQDSP